MKKNSSTKSPKTTATTAPTFFHVVNDIDWVRGLEVGNHATGIAYHDGKIQHVIVEKDSMSEAVKVKAEPISLGDAARKQLSLLEVEVDLGLTALTSDTGTARWLSQIQSEL